MGPMITGNASPSAPVEPDLPVVWGVEADGISAVIWHQGGVPVDGGVSKEAVVVICGEVRLREHVDSNKYRRVQSPSADGSPRQIVASTVLSK